MSEKLTIRILKTMCREMGLIIPKYLNREKLIWKILNSMKTVCEVNDYLEKLTDPIDVYNIFVILQSEADEECSQTLIYKKFNIIKNKIFNLTETQWKLLYRREKFTYKFMTTFKDILNFNEIIIYQRLDSDFIAQVHDKIDFSLLIKYQNIPYYILDLFGDEINWNLISLTQDIPDWLLSKYYDKLNHVELIKKKFLSLSFICLMLAKVNREQKFENLSTTSEEEYYKVVLWPYLIRHQYLTKGLIYYIYVSRVKHEPDSIRKYFGSLVSKFQVLDSHLLETLQEDLNWFSVSCYQTLTDEDLIKHCQRINFKVYISRGLQISEFVKANLPKPFAELKCKLNCPICFELKGCGVILKTCNHTFCDACILNWLKDKTTCPMCRTEIPYLLFLNYC